MLRRGTEDTHLWPAHHSFYELACFVGTNLVLYSYSFLLHCVLCDISCSCNLHQLQNSRNRSSHFFRTVILQPRLSKKKDRVLCCLRASGCQLCFSGNAILHECKKLFERW